ncbi:MAG: hypothetical protein IJW18_02345 [Lachnospiraceae bacterium]|nr:hypothetical protein [Lachnospiraceae bacterium]
MVSYIYVYEGNRKLNMAGFVKLEARGRDGRLSIRINDANMPANNAVNVCFLYDAPTLRSLSLGKKYFVVNGKVAEAELRFDAMNIANGGFDISRMQGMYFEIGNMVLATAWIDMDIRPDDIIKEQGEVKKDEPVEAIHAEEALESGVYEAVDGELDEAERYTAAEVVAKPEAYEAVGGELDGAERYTATEVVKESETYEEVEAAEELEESERYTAAEVTGESEAHEEAETTEEYAESEETLCAAVLQDDIEDRAVAADTLKEKDIEEEEIIDTFVKALESMEEKTEELRRNPWNRLCCKYPKVIGFEKDKDRVCLKVNLKAMELILGRQYRMGSNTFAIKSYCKYNYLLLIENPEDTEGQSCLVGAPGHFNSNDDVLARMCGFNEFRTAKGEEACEEKFGYWLKKINL